MPDLTTIKENVNRMLSDGASEQEVDAYLQLAGKPTTVTYENTPEEQAVGESLGLPMSEKSTFAYEPPEPDGRAKNILLQFAKGYESTFPVRQIVQGMDAVYGTEADKGWQDVPAPEGIPAKVAAGLGGVAPMVASLSPFMQGANVAIKGSTILSKLPQAAQSMVRAAGGFAGHAVARDVAEGKSLGDTALDAVTSAGTGVILGAAGAGAAKVIPNARVATAVGQGAAQTGLDLLTNRDMPLDDKVANTVVASTLGVLFPHKEGRQSPTLGQLNQTIDDVMMKVIRPSSMGKDTAARFEGYKQKVRDAINLVAANKGVLTTEVDGQKVAKNPESLQDLADAISTTRNEIYKQYSRSQKGVVLDVTGIGEQLLRIGNSKVVRLSNPEAADFAIKMGESFIKSRTLSANQAVKLLEEYNAEQKAFFYGKSSKPVSRLTMESRIAHMLRGELDSRIKQETGVNYAQLKRAYGSLAEAERGVTKRIVSEAKRADPKVGVLLEIISKGEIVHGALTGNAAGVARGALQIGLHRLWKYVNNPDVRVRTMFENIDRLHSADPEMWKIGQANKARNGMKITGNVPESEAATVEAFNKTKVTPASTLDLVQNAGVVPETNQAQEGLLATIEQQSKKPAIGRPSNADKRTIENNTIIDQLNAQSSADRARNLRLSQFGVGSSETPVGYVFNPSKNVSLVDIHGVKSKFPSGEHVTIVDESDGTFTLETKSGKRSFVSGGELEKLAKYQTSGTHSSEFSVLNESPTDKHIDLEAKILRDTGIPESDLPKYILSSNTDGAKLREYTNRVKSGEWSTEEAIRNIRKDYMTLFNFPAQNENGKFIKKYNYFPKDGLTRAVKNPTDMHIAAMPLDRKYDDAVRLIVDHKNKIVGTRTWGDPYDYASTEEGQAEFKSKSFDMQASAAEAFKREHPDYRWLPDVGRHLERYTEELDGSGGRLDNFLIREEPPAKTVDEALKPKKRVVGAPNGVEVKLDNLRSLAEKGVMGAEWYRDAGYSVADAFGSKLYDKALKIFAEVSTGTKPDANIQWTLKPIYQKLLGQKVSTGRYPATFEKNVNAILNGKEPSWNNPEGLKKKSFYETLKMYADQRLGFAAAEPALGVMDMWMARAFGYKNDTVAPTQYRYMDAKVKELAANMGIPFWKAQAQIWTGTQMEMRRVSPSVFSGFENLSGGIYSEYVAPMDSHLDFRGKSALSNIMHKAFTDANGKSEILKAVGIVQGKTDMGVGGWEGAVSPAVKSIIYGTTFNFDTKLDMQVVERAASALGYVLRQDAVAFSKDSSTGVQAAVIDIGRPMNIKESARFAELIKEAGVSGFAPDERGVRVIDYDGKLTKKQLGAILGTATDKFRGEFGIEDAVVGQYRDGGRLIFGGEDGKDYRKGFNGDRKTENEVSRLRAKADKVREAFYKEYPEFRKVKTSGNRTK